MLTLQRVERKEGFCQLPMISVLPRSYSSIWVANDCQWLPMMPVMHEGGDRIRVRENFIKIVHKWIAGPQRVTHCFKVLQYFINRNKCRIGICSQWNSGTQLNWRQRYSSSNEGWRQRPSGEELALVVASFYNDYESLGISIIIHIYMHVYMSVSIISCS